MTCTGCGLFEAAGKHGLCKVCEATPAERRPNAALARDAKWWNARAAERVQRKRRPKEAS